MNIKGDIVCVGNKRYPEKWKAMNVPYIFIHDQLSDDLLDNILIRQRKMASSKKITVHIPLYLIMETLPTFDVQESLHMNGVNVIEASKVTSIVCSQAQIDFANLNTYKYPKLTSKDFKKLVKTYKV